MRSLGLSEYPATPSGPVTLAEVIQRLMDNLEVGADRPMPVYSTYNWRKLNGLALWNQVTC